MGTQLDGKSCRLTEHSVWAKGICPINRTIGLAAVAAVRLENRRNRDYWHGTACHQSSLGSSPHIVEACKITTEGFSDIQMD